MQSLNQYLLGICIPGTEYIEDSTEPRTFSLPWRAYILTRLGAQSRKKKINIQVGCQGDLFSRSYPIIN